jgi:hypothetical protein
MDESRLPVVTNEFLYSFDVGDCELSVCWNAYRVLRKTPKLLFVADRSAVRRVDRSELEAKGETHCRSVGKYLYTAERKAEMIAKDPYNDKPVHEVPYWPDKTPKPTPEQLLWAEELIREHFQRHPEDRGDARCHDLLMQHDLDVPRTFIAKIRKELGQVSRPAPPPSEAQYEALLAFLAAVAAKSGKHAGFEEGPKWYRIVTEEVDPCDQKIRTCAYCFVRKEDGAIFQTDGYKVPRLKSGILGHLHDYSRHLLGQHGVRNRQRIRQLEAQDKSA